MTIPDAQSSIVEVLKYDSASQLPGGVIIKNCNISKHPFFSGEKTQESALSQASNPSTEGPEETLRNTKRLEGNKSNLGVRGGG